MIGALGATQRLRIDGCTFTDNISEGAAGGGLQINAVPGTVGLEVVDSTFIGNEATPGGGGAIAVRSRGTAILGGVVMTDNVAGGVGGAIELTSIAGDVGILEVWGGLYQRNAAASYSAAFDGRDWTGTFIDVDLGAGTNTNTPQDLQGCDTDYGAGESLLWDSGAPAIDGVCP